MFSALVIALGIYAAGTTTSLIAIWYRMVWLQTAMRTARVCAEEAVDEARRAIVLVQHERKARKQVGIAATDQFNRCMERLQAVEARMGLAS